MENGKAAIARGLVNGLGFGSTEFHVLRPAQGVLAEWLFHFVRRGKFREDAKTHFSGAVGQQRVPASFVRDYPIPLPSTTEQHRIVAEIELHLSRLDAGVAALKRARANLRRYRASVLKAACEGRLVSQDPSDEPASELLKHILAERRGRWEADQFAKLQQSGPGPVGDNWKSRYREPELSHPNNVPLLPQGWLLVSLGAISSLIADVDHKMPQAQLDGVPYVSTRDFCGEDGIDFDKAKRIAEEDYIRLSRKIRPELGDILLSRYGTVGEVRKVRTTHRFHTSYSIAIVKTLPFPLTNDYLVVALRSEVVQSQMRRDIRATAQPDLGLEYIRQFSIPLPPLAEQERIVAEVERRLSVVDELEATIASNLKRADRLRQAILKRAFEGRLVPQDPDDEPASVLLARIRGEKSASAPGGQRRASHQLGLPMSE